MISATKEQILRHLAEYKYLTVTQLTEELNIALKPAKCRQYLREMRTLGYATKLTHMAVPRGANKDTIVRRVRHEDMHYLTRKGATFLDNLTELSISEIRYARKIKHTLSNDYFHRMSTVSMNISFNRWIEENDFEDEDYLVYYDKRGLIEEGEFFKAETRIDLKDNKHYTPDVLAKFTKRNEPFGFLLELYHGNRTKYVMKQLNTAFSLIERTTLISANLKIKKTPRVLLVFDNPTLLNNVFKSIKADPYFSFDALSEMLFFNLDTAVWKDFGKGWKNIRNEERDLTELQTIKF